MTEASNASVLNQLSADRRVALSAPDLAPEAAPIVVVVVDQQDTEPSENPDEPDEEVESDTKTTPPHRTATGRTAQKAVKA